MRIDFTPFSGAALVAVPVEPVLHAMALARHPRNWQRSFTGLDTPLDLTHIAFFIETPCVERDECETWASVDYDEICARVRRWLLTPPVQN